MNEKPNKRLETMLALVTKNGMNLWNVPVEFKNNKKVVTTAIRENIAAFEFASDELKQDKEIVLMAIRAQNSRDTHIGGNVHIELPMEHIPVHFTDDKDIMMQAVAIDGLSLWYASDRLKKDKAIVSTAVRENIAAFEFASDELKQDKEIVLMAIKIQDRVDTYVGMGKSSEYIDLPIQHVPEQLTDDKDVMMQSVTIDGLSLWYASDDLKNDKEVVMAAVHENITAFEFSLDEMYDDKDVVMSAIRFQLIKDTWDNRNSSYTHANEPQMRLVSERLCGDKEVIMHAVNLHGPFLEYASNELKEDREVVLVAVQHEMESSEKRSAIEFAADVFKQDEQIVRAAIQTNGMALAHCQKFILRRDLCILAITKTPEVFAYTTFYHNDKKMALLAFTEHGGGEQLAVVSDELKDDRDVVMTAVNSYGPALEYASKRLKNDEAIVIAAINSNGESIAYASPELRRNKGIVMNAITSGEGNGFLLMYADPIFNDDFEVIMTAIHNTDSETVDNIYVDVSPRCKLQIELIDYMYKKDGQYFFERLPAEAWTKPNVLDWALTIPEEDIPEAFVGKVKALRVIQKFKLPNALKGNIASFGGTRKIKLKKLKTKKK